MLLDNLVAQWRHEVKIYLKLLEISSHKTYFDNVLCLSINSLCPPDPVLSATIIRSFIVLDFSGIHIEHYLLKNPLRVFIINGRNIIFRIFYSVRISLIREGQCSYWTRPV